ncbi:related to Ras-GTPase-activating protein binding protein 2 [Cephalotrichum gorgonifer]|uniref:Related to Ras-GTPase-activating protein binding protein 2 n=1 Tax=Cephalotrichum gorgonifer TaxID=2041049 RepID=A0AAE8N0X5_9PEZI|nr:related to Ras-GTPase-activating protein binding protein 2 [Cephalotrichum gorgonifer]
MATINGNNFHHQEQNKPAEGAYTPAAESIPEQSTSGGTNHDLSKDEVGWYFVEQYYTTLSKSPEKLHLFYGKRSQFVYGLEAEVANVSVGRQAIQERIKQLDFQECKVRVSNVDSLSSFDNIVIQVIGETSTKTSPEPRKFVQTFVLAKQPSGYFVLNDVWRYINDEEEQAEQATQEAAQVDEPVPVPVETAAEPKTEEAVEVEPAKEEPVEVKPSPIPEPELVDKKLEEVAKTQEVSTADDTAKEVPAESSSKAAPSEDSAAKEAAEETLKEAEKPRDPAPTPAAARAKSPAAPAAAPVSEPEKPAKPMTWAGRAAAAAATTAARPAPALPKTATPPAVAPTKAAVPAPAAATKPAPAPQRSEPSAAAQDQAASEWQTAGSDSKRQNRPQSTVGQPEKEGTLGYVKYVTEKVQDADLRAALTNYGALTYFDINREKNCAFVEFATPEGYKAAVAANPHSVNGESIFVEQRRPKSTAYGGAQYAANRGGASSGRGRGRYDGARAGSQGGPKAPFGSQTRGRGGGGGAPRGKSSQPANA